MIVNIILWLLALYGLWSIFNLVWESFQSTKKPKANLSVLLIVNNWEDKVEKVIRYLANQSYFNKHPLTPVDVVAVDKGSADNTLKILKQLARNYSFLKVVDSKRISSSSVVEYGKNRCVGEVVLVFDDADFDNLEDIEQAIKFYFSNSNCKFYKEE
ncbi:glycosyltransferase [Proteinivorax hydrogeniformans]|uniref:Glycosyltransferase n=1 Tax=Proteinivorax hydrogeniformans TaxID=1826727 RepID=A0AAU8HUX6_9FIRM